MNDYTLIGIIVIGGVVLAWKLMSCMGEEQESIAKPKHHYNQDPDAKEEPSGDDVRDDD